MSVGRETTRHYVPAETCQVPEYCKQLLTSAEVLQITPRMLQITKYCSGISTDHCMTCNTQAHLPTVNTAVSAALSIIEVTFGTFIVCNDYKNVQLENNIQKEIRFNACIVQKSQNACKTSKKLYFARKYILWHSFWTINDVEYMNILCQIECYMYMYMQCSPMI